MKKFDNFCKALENLQDVYKYEEPYDNVILTGLTALYEICFEQAWKAIKEILEEQGYSESQTGSPRQILKTAFRAGMIRDEDIWLAALTARNNVSYAYNQAVALDILKQTKEIYCNMFKSLKKEIEEKWV